MEQGVHKLEVLRLGATAPGRAENRIAPVSFAAPIAALCYPFLLALSHREVIHRGTGAVGLGSLLLLAAIAAPFVGIYVYWRLGSNRSPSPAEVRAKGVALLSVAAPPLYTTLGVVLTIAHSPVSDLAFWVVLWAAAAATLLRNGATTLSQECPKIPVLHPRLRFAHGVVAALIVCVFLGMHLLNHLSALWDVDKQRLLMNAFRHVYRARLVEPLLVALILFQLVSGPVLLRQYLGRAVDVTRTLQIASGAYLLIYLPGHMNSVFIYARAIAGIPTDWNFATGAPAGLLMDAWNIRLIPHYLLGVFFVVMHLVLGARIIALGHHLSSRTADHLAFVGIAGGALLAIAIMVGMLGIHFGN